MKPVSKFSIIVTIVALLVIGWVVFTHKNPAPTAVTNTPGTETPAVTWPSKEVDHKTISDSNQYYDIEVTYPVTKDVAINDTMKAFAEDQVKQFKDDTAWVTDPSVGSSAEGNLSLQVSYVEQQSTVADNYIFTIGTYTGGAHGLQATKTFSYSKTGTPITLDTLFLDKAKGLQTTATFVQGELTKRNISDPQWIKDGAGPTTENYQNFVIGDDGLTVIFDPYQVAPYAAGTQKILVPNAVFAKIQNPKL